jgi:predicted PhzF superfamily epimerase YddE/YHI9
MALRYSWLRRGNAGVRPDFALNRTGRFAGNPAAVMPMDRFSDDALLQAIAAENNWTETAFPVPEGGD